uniref:Uncharacterized protein n=1 Tax=Plectus sambesii TaxID=2011161 RepID=A0A914W4M7_9BILA
MEPITSEMELSVPHLATMSSVATSARRWIMAGRVGDTGTPPTMTSTDDICAICGDEASGRHYGATACNGCKGFFRRTVRKNHIYSCRFDGKCVVDKQNRAVCRHCRYRKCLTSGMVREGVQKERDGLKKNVIKGRDEAEELKEEKADRSTRESCTLYEPFTPRWASPEQVIGTLTQAESLTNQLRSTVIRQTGTVNYDAHRFPVLSGTKMEGATADINDVGQGIHSQLLLVVEWAKLLPPFMELPMIDRAALLKQFAGQHVVLGLAWRSMNRRDGLVLSNGSFLPRDHFEIAGMSYKSVGRILDELIAPMNLMQIDEVEFVALKACVFFNPVARGVQPESSAKILQARRQTEAALEQYIGLKTPSTTGGVSRLTDLLMFVLSPLQATAQSMAEDMLISKVIGLTNLDKLMEELILIDDEPRIGNLRVDNTPFEVLLNVKQSDC